MKNYFFPLEILLLLFIAISCSGDDENPEKKIEPVATDISVQTSENLISWSDGSDLLQKLENAISYTNGEALESELDKNLSINADSTQAAASIAFKTAFINEYTDTNTTNNSISIRLEKEIEIVVGGVTLDADGLGNTYNLITSVLAPGHNPIETPDCNHAAFGDHIDEVFDSELNTNVFQFHMHATPDNDRCINFDRQRNEIKTYDKSPDNLLGIENETVVYKWKFKLAAGFQSSPNFTHLHQLKSVGGSLESMPMYTLTTRKGSPDQLELRYAETSSQVTLKKTDLAPLIGNWLQVTETISYGSSGSYEIEIKKVSDNSVLFDYVNSSIINWRPGADFVRPKWGIYRSLINSQDLRDETLRFANFSIEEIE